MARICQWRYTPGCDNATAFSVAPSDTCLDDFTCTCVKLGNCLTACDLEECFGFCQPWSHWAATCAFAFHGKPVTRNRSRICKCDERNQEYKQLNINSTCYQFSTCETRWELYRLLLFIFSCVVIVTLVVGAILALLEFLRAPPSEQYRLEFNQNPPKTTIGLAEDVAAPEDREFEPA